MSTHHFTGSYPVLDIGSSHIWCRQDVQLPEGSEAVVFSAALNCGDIDMAPFCQLRLIDNDTLEDTVFAAGGIPPR